MNKILKPEQVIVGIDSREQNPLDLSPLKTQKVTLQTADYTIIGLEKEIAAERKNIDDLCMCVGRERERFEKEIQRLLSFQCPILIIEAHLIEIKLQKYRSAVSPQAVLGSIYSWQARGINVIWGGDHKTSGEILAGVLFSFARHYYRIGYSFAQSINSKCG